MYEILFDGEYDYNILFVINLELAEQYMKLGEKETAMDMLLRCEHIAAEWDKIKELPYTETYRTPLLNLIPKHVKAVDAFEKGETRGFNFRSIFLSELKRLDIVFSPLYDNIKYKEMVLRLNV
jgi:hypothetical protein